MADRLTGRRLRHAHTFDVPLSEGVVTLRRLDMMNEWLLGKTEHALVSQVYATEQIFATLNPTISTLEALEALPAEERHRLLVGLRLFATLAVVSPRLTVDDDDDPDAAPVTMFGFADLMAIWNAKAPDDVTADPTQPLAVPAAEGGDDTVRFPETTADAQPAAAARDHAAGAREPGPPVAVPPQRTPYVGLVSLTTH